MGLSFEYCFSKTAGGAVGRLNVDIQFHMYVLWDCLCVIRYVKWDIFCEALDGSVGGF